MTTLRVQPTAIAHGAVPIDALAPHPRNYRRHPDEQLARLAASLARFGQVRSIVVQAGAPGRYLVVAGHGIVEAARRNGLTELAADIIPADWTAEQVEGYLVADNEHARGADDDLIALAELLEGQRHAGYALESLGYDADELDTLLQELADAHLEDEPGAAEPPIFKDYDEHVEDDLPTEMCETCGKLCLKPKHA